jgi:hypothetical protein
MPVQLCSKVRDLIDQSSQLKYRQALFACSMVDGRGSLSSAQRLKLLEQREQAWSRLAWRSEDIARLELPDNSGRLRRTYGK